MRTYLIEGYEEDDFDGSKSFLTVKAESPEKALEKIDRFFVFYVYEVSARWRQRTSLVKESL